MEERKTISKEKRRKKTYRHGSGREDYFKVVKGVRLNWIEYWLEIWSDSFAGIRLWNGAGSWGWSWPSELGEVTVVFQEEEFKFMFIVNHCGLEEPRPHWKEMWLGGKLSQTQGQWNQYPGLHSWGAGALLETLEDTGVLFTGKRASCLRPSS